MILAVLTGLIRGGLIALIMYCAVRLAIRDLRPPTFEIHITRGGER